MSQNINSIRIASASSEKSNTSREVVLRRFSDLDFLVVDAINNGTPALRLESDVYEVAQLNRSVIVGEADAAVYAAYRLPYPLPEGLHVVALLQPEGQVLSELESGVLLSEREPQHPLNGFVAMVTRTDSELPFERFALEDVRRNWGSVSVAGFGPGNAELITVKALKALQNADIIFYDDLLDATLLDEFTAEKIYVGKRSSRHAFRQELINDQLWRAAISGKKVARIKGGDPLIFGRGIEEYHYLKARLIEAEIVPGISSAMAAAADSLVPLTARGVSSSVAFLSGHDLEKIVIPKADTLVFFMGAAQQPQLAQKLIELGWSPQTPVAVVQNASYSHRDIRRYTLRSLSAADDCLLSPVIILVGWTASANPDDKPKKWLYTDNNISDFQESGLSVHAPFFRFKSANPELLPVLNKTRKADRILFTNPQSVEYFFAALLNAGLDVRSIYHLEIDAVDDKTARALKKAGLLVKPIAADGNETQVLDFYRNSVKSDKQLLLPGSDEFPSLFGILLKDAGYTVVNLPVYRIEPLKNLLVHNLPDFHGVVFTSPEAVTRFSEVYNGFPSYLEYAFRGAFAHKRFIGLGGVITPSIKSSPSERKSATHSEIESAFYRMVL